MPNLIERVSSFLAGKSASTAPMSPDLIERAVDAAGAQAAFSSGVLHRPGLAPRKGSREILAMYSTNPWMRILAHQVGSAVARVEWKLYAQRSKGSKKDAPHYIVGDVTRSLLHAPHAERRSIIARASASGDLDEITTHPLLKLLAYPNPSMSGFAMRLATVVQYDFVGESFWILDRDASGMPIEARPCPPTWVKEVPTPAKPWFVVAFNGHEWQVPATEVIWFRDVDPADPYGRGVGLGMSAADEVDIDEHAAKMVNAYFHNSGMPSAIVSLKGARPEIVAAAKRKWNDALQGFRKAYSTYFTGAEIDVKRLDTTFKDMALVDIRKSQRDTFISLYGMPPEKVGVLANSNRATIDAADLIEAKNVIVPRLEMMRDEMQAKLVSQYDDGKGRLILDYVSPIPGDREFNRTVMERFSSYFTIDEVRGLAGADPLPDDKGKAFMVEQGKQYVPDLAALNTAPIYGYHLQAGVVTNNELRARLGLDAVPGWGDERAVGFYMGEGMGDPEAGLDTPSLPPGEAAARVGVTRSGRLPTVDLRAFTPTAKRSSSYLSGKEIKRILRAIDEREMSGAMTPVLRDLVETFGEETSQAIGNELHFDADAPAVKAHFDEIADERAKMVTTTTKFEARRVLEAWDGEDDDELRAALGEVFERGRVERSIGIAATEGKRSSEFATHEAVKQAGIKAEKEWIAVADGSTREAHLDMDGQRVGIDEPYTVKSGKHAGAQAQHPGAFGIGGLDINCRCHSAPSFAGDGDLDDALDDLADLLASAPPTTKRVALLRSGVVPANATKAERVAAWQVRDTKVRKFETRIADAVAGAFDKQEAAAMSALASIID